MSGYPETNHQILSYKQTLEQFLSTIKKLWKSKKARTEAFFTSNCNLLPKKYIISREVVPIEEKDCLIETLLSGVKRGYNVGVRTCFSPQPDSSPWVMGIKTVEDVEHFLTHEYLDWSKLPGITELIVMNNPKDLGYPEKSDEFFVFKMGERSQEKFSGCYIELRLDTFQLRDLEADTSQNDMITIKITDFENIEIIIRANYTADNQQINYQITGDDFDKIKQDLTNQLTDKHLATISSFLAELKYLMRDSQIALKRRLIAFDEFGLEYSEWQAQIDQDGTCSWMKIYGFKGSNDDTHWSPIKKINGRKS